MKKNKNEKTMSELLSEISFDITDELLELLKIEYEIKFKKAKGERLTRDEYFFDTYMISPSTILKCIYSRDRF